MKFIHTSDWHLGKRIFGRNLLEDQRHVMAQIIEYTREHQPGAVIVAGDIYDRSNPPIEAMGLFENTVATIAGDLNIPMLITPGNHDSAARVAFMKKLVHTACLD